MSEVRKWWIGTFQGEAQARTCSRFKLETITELFDETFVLASDFDAAQFELSALREELASANADKEAYGQNAIDIQHRLTAAEHRYADMRKAIEAILPLAALIGTQVELDLIHAALKPNESGASE